MEEAVAAGVAVAAVAAGEGVVKTDAGIEFHINFCDPNPMKPTMPMPCWKRWHPIRRGFRIGVFV